jgi:serine/threonine protein kinase/Tfp pilus assembly protein PilF
MLGQTISHYRILEKLGEGGMGVVYLAEDKNLGRRVAIKFLNSTDHHYRARFIREARAVSILNHPNIATVYEYGESDSAQPFIVMEYVNGKSLTDALDEGLTLRRSVEIISAIGEALIEAHEHGIVHRDIKPSNVVMNERGQVKVLDFGLAKQLFTSSSNGVDLNADTVYSTQTRSDVIVGTPLYLSPEQARGKAVDGRSDIFSLGSLLYECLTGQPAFAGSSIMEIGAQIIHVMPKAPSQINPRVSEELDRITLKALEKDIDRRYQSAELMVRDLRSAAEGLSGEKKVVSNRKNASTVGARAWGTKSLNMLTTSLRRPRFSFNAIAAAIALTVALVVAAIYWWPRSYYQPSLSALTWYDRGTDALRNGAYYQASKALQQAIAIDKNYSLAHARLAQAWAELDFTDRAKDELLSADRSSLSPVDSLYLEAITATVRRDFGAAIKAYDQIAKMLPDQPDVYIDLGYAYENNGDVDKALENYLKSLEKKNGQYATAFLRSGIVYNRKQDTTRATESFDKAEGLYRAETNNEGVNEVRRQRGILFREKGRYAEAREQFQQSLDAARVLGNEAQQVSAMIELSTLSTNEGNSSEALKMAQQAVELAQQRNLESLAAGGLIELGNSFHDKGDYSDAEKYYLQAIDLAQTGKSKRREAIARSNLGGMYIQTQRIDQGLPLIEQSLSFFQQGNFPKNVSYCLTQIARGNRRKGDYSSALRALAQKMELAQQGGNQPAIADVYAELGAVFYEQGNYPASFDNYSKALDIYKQVGNPIKAAYSQTNKTNVLWRLGRFDEAKENLTEVSTVAAGGTGVLKPLVAALRLIDAQMFLSQRNFSLARTKVSEAIELAGDEYQDTMIESKFTLGLVIAQSSKGSDGEKLCEESVKLADKSGDLALKTKAMLAQAEAALESGNARRAADITGQLQGGLAAASQLEAEWRALLIRSKASAQLGDREGASAQLSQAKTVCNQLQQSWGAEAFNRYVLRPDIQIYYRELN